MERYLCIHCHFYQPPRENPWLEAIELQDSAYPYHDWNERITAECYAPNASSRLLDAEGRIQAIVNNYARISFNFGPTLLSWLEDRAPRVYHAILEADRASEHRFSGHGSAIAQAYNHAILPLANDRDRYTQILWGIRDFEFRFGRHPEGMWLPEAAVDSRTLEILADLGIRFTVLAPRQAGKLRKLGGRAWKDVHGGRIDPSRAYLAKLPGKKTISLFFYDGPISQAVAFEGLLNNGETFARRLLGGFSDQRNWPQLMHIATDGETYGHHHRFGDMALAYALHHIESNNLARLTNYAEFLDKHPAEVEVQIVENSSWSCVHGVDRWRSNCSCNTGRPDWNQEWRAPLRTTLDWLRDELAPKYEIEGAKLLKDPWAARNDYVNVVLDRSGESLAGFLERHATAGNGLEHSDRVRLLKLLELQRHAMLMFTSCGWFFDELSGIETVQVIMYAGRAIQLAQELFGNHLEQGFLERIAQAVSNIPEQGTGADIYRKWVKPAAIDLLKVGAHYAISSLFEHFAEKDSIYCYAVERQDQNVDEAGRARLALGCARVCSRVTLEEVMLAFGAIHLGDHNVNAGVRPFAGSEPYQKLVSETREAFASGDVPQTIRVLDRHFDGATYNLRSLFKDEQRKIVDVILNATLEESESTLRQLYETHAPLLRFLSEMGAQLPKVFSMIAEFVVNGSLRREFESGFIDVERVRVLLDVARREQVMLDSAGLAYTLRHSVETMIERLQRKPEDMPLLERIVEVVSMATSLPFPVDLWRSQNRYYEMLRQVRPQFERRNDDLSRSWLQTFDRLGEKLKIYVPEPQPELPLPQAA